MLAVMSLRAGPFGTLPGGGRGQTQFPQDLAKLKHALFSGNPLCGLQRSAREAFAAFRRVAQGDGVRSAVKSDLMGSHMRTSAARAEGQVSAESGSAHHFSECFQRAGRSVFLCGVMNLPTPGFVFGMLRKKRGGFAYDLQEQIHADSEISAEDQ